MTTHERNRTSNAARINYKLHHHSLFYFILFIFIFILSIYLFLFIYFIGTRAATQNGAFCETYLPNVTICIDNKVNTFISNLFEYIYACGDPEHLCAWACAFPAASMILEALLKGP